MIEIIMMWRDKGRIYFKIYQIVKRVILEPSMCLYLFWSVKPKSIDWLSLKSLINEVCSFNTPSFWYFMSLYLHLFRKYVVPYIFPCFPIIRPLSKHSLVSHHSNSEVINSYSMVLPTHHFWSHISRCPTCILRIFWSPYSCNSKIC